MFCALLREARLLGRVLALAAAMAAVSSATAQEPIHQGFDVAVMHAPAVTTYPDGARLVYELHLTSFADDTLMLTGVEILDRARGVTLASYDSAALEALIGTGATEQASNARAIAPGARAVLYLAAPIGEAGAPGAILHRIAFERIRDGATAQVTRPASTAGAR